ANLRPFNDELIAIGLAMEEVQDQQEKSDFSAMAREFLATSAASNEVNQELLAQAEAQTGLKRTGDDLLPLYETDVDLLAQNAEGTEELGDATDDAVGVTYRYGTALKGATLAAGLDGKAKLDLTAINESYTAQVEAATEAERDYISQIEDGLRSVFDYEE